MIPIMVVTEKETGKENEVNPEIIETEKDSSTASVSEKCGTGIANVIKTETVIAQLTTGTPSVSKWTIEIENVAFSSEGVAAARGIIGIEGTGTGWIVTAE